MCSQFSWPAKETEGGGTCTRQAKVGNHQKEEKKKGRGRSIEEEEEKENGLLCR